MNSTAMTMENMMQTLHANIMSFYATYKKQIIIAVALMALALISLDAIAAATSDTWADGGYTFILNAATGKFARAICIGGGLAFLLAAAGGGRPLLALGGVILAMFGFLSPTLINAIFGSALI